MPENKNYVPDFGLGLLRMWFDCLKMMLIIPIIGIIILCLSLIIRYTTVQIHACDVAEKCLRTHSDIEYEDYWTKYKAVFQTSEYKNTAIVFYNDGQSLEVYDYNKSKITGKWVGQKSKQFGKGLIQGIKE